MMIVILILLCLALLYFLAARWVCPYAFDETHFVSVGDGRHVTLHRLGPKGEKKRRHPVLLCHGLGANRFNLALPGRYSIAELLSREGYDVFCLELSGAGLSVPPNRTKPGRWDICFDDFVERDGPAAIDHVLQTTGAGELFWVGHSMGGLIAYVLSQGPFGEKIRGGVTLAGPGSFAPITAYRTVARFDFLLRPFPCLHLGLFSFFATPLLSLIPARLLTRVIRVENTAPATTKYVAANVLSTIPMKLILQLSRWMKTGTLRSESGYDYQEHYDRVTTPFLLLAGGGDTMVPAAAVRFAFDRMSSKDKTYHCFTKANGGQTDYGHGDIIFGRDAPDEVHPMILQWINARD